MVSITLSHSAGELAAVLPLEFSWRALISPPFLLIFLRVLCTAKTILAVCKGYMGCDMCDMSSRCCCLGSLSFAFSYRGLSPDILRSSGRGGLATVNLLVCLFNGHQSSVFTKTLFYAHLLLHAKKSTLAFMAGYWLLLVQAKLRRD